MKKKTSSDQFRLRRISGTDDEFLRGSGYSLTAISAYHLGAYGVYLEGSIEGEVARWFIPNKVGLSRGETYLIHQILQNPASRRQFHAPSLKEELLSETTILKAASKHLHDVKIIQPGSASDYPQAWASVTVLTVDPVVNKNVLQRLRSVNGIKIGSYKKQAYIMAEPNMHKAHVSNQYLLDILSSDTLEVNALLPHLSDSSYPALEKGEKPAKKAPAIDSRPSLSDSIENIKNLGSTAAEIELRKLKSGIDQYTKAKPEDLRALISPNDLDILEKAFRTEKNKLSAMRWIARGLPAALAVKKVNLMNETADFFVSVNRASGALFEP